MTCPCEDCNKDTSLRWLGFLICVVCAAIQIGAAVLVVAK